MNFNDFGIFQNKWQENVKNMSLHILFEDLGVDVVAFQDGLNKVH